MAVVYQNFTLAWTDDGGRTIRMPPLEPEGLFMWRFGAHGIDWVRIKDEFLHVKIVRGVRGLRERGIAYSLHSPSKTLP